VADDVAADMLRKADAFVAAARGPDREALDFSLESLVALDALLERLFARRWALRPGGALDVGRFGPMVEPAGAYLGESLRRTLGGAWEPGGGLRLPSGAVVQPLEQAHRRFAEGHPASLGPYGAAVAAAER
jgi:hypothetical protein